MSWDCWIGDENGANKVELYGTNQPKPRPWPQPVLVGSEHEMLDGTLQAQRRAYRRTIEVNLPRATPTIRSGLEALFYAFTSGAQDKVQVNNGDKTFLCSWAEAPTWNPVDDRLPERWAITCKFLIESEVT